jgi:hypothetical protein
LSAHADRDEMLSYFQKCGSSHIRQAFCVHGEPDVLGPFADSLRGIGMQKVSTPVAGQAYEL